MALGSTWWGSDSGGCLLGASGLTGQIVAVGVGGNAPRHIRLARGLARDGSEAEKLWEQWMNDEDAHFTSDRTREYADVVVSGIGEA